MGCINAVKVPENDLDWYIEAYQNASYMDFGDYLRFGASLTGDSSKEQVYAIIAWCLNRTFDGNVLLFKFFITLINYLLLNFTIVKYCKYFKFSINKIILAVFLMCFIPYIFTMSLHLIRQFLAGSILVYVLINDCFFHKKNWILIICMILIHSTSIIFIPFLVLSFWDKPVKKNKIYYITALMALLALQFLSKIVLDSGLFTKIDSLQYALERASQNTVFELKYLSAWKIFVLIINAICHYYVGYIQIDKIVPNIGLKRYCNTILFLSIFILLNLHQAELSNRFFFYLFSFVPFMIIWISNQLKFPVSFNIFLGVFMMFFWMIYLNVGTWEYALPANIWISPVLLYFL
jgi:hypothetical protein